jgi:hypothetical protein
MNNPEGETNGPRIYKIPDGDDRERLTCPDCGFIAYENPRIVVGVVARADDERILLCRRAIPPRIGYWTLPAGYMELGETAEDAMKDAKASFFDGQRGVGYEFACWCSDIAVRECTADLRNRVESEGRLNVSKQALSENLK